MPQDRGVVYIAVGARYRTVALQSQKALSNFSSMKTIILEKQAVKSFTMLQQSRWLKINLDLLSPFYDTLYLDADTIPYTCVDVGFDILKDGFDLVITPSGNQEQDSFWHLTEKERISTVKDVGFGALQLQGGVFWFRKTAEILRFFAEWRRQWWYYKDQDQGALIRALYRYPLKTWLLGRDWNGGMCIGHRFGIAR